MNSCISLSVLYITTEPTVYTDLMVVASGFYMDIYETSDFCGDCLPTVSKNKTPLSKSRDKTAPKLHTRNGPKANPMVPRAEEAHTHDLQGPCNIRYQPSDL